MISRRVVGVAILFTGLSGLALPAMVFSQPSAGHSRAVANRAPATAPTRAPVGKPQGAGRSGYSEAESRVTHLLNRIGFGPKPGDTEAVMKIGIDEYINRQLQPASIQLPGRVAQMSQLTAVGKTPVELFRTYGRPTLMAITSSGQADEATKEQLQKTIRDTYRKLYSESTTARIVRATESPRQLQEVMTDFWFNHFNITSDKNLDHLWIGCYEEQAIRPHVLGKFRDLLESTSHHAGMLFYLDNWQNTSAKAFMKGGRFQGINENYARELMELHTLGVDGGYTQKDVQELARVLTGLGLPPGAGTGFGVRDPRKRREMMLELGMLERAPVETDSIDPTVNYLRSGCYFDERRHDYGEKIVLGKRIAGSGEPEISQVLDMLARHPSTARHISYKLAQYFVADTPPASLVNTLTARFKDTDGDIRAVMETLLKSPEFWDPNNRNSKFKSPYRYLISSLRASEGKVYDVQPANAFLTQAGMPLYRCVTPDGYKNTRSAWLNPDNLLNRLNFATAYGAGKLPRMVPGISDPELAANCFASSLSDKTITAFYSSPEPLKLPVLLGSPEFMLY